MRLNHINIAVTDVSAARSFLETYFGFHCVTQRGQETLAIMMDDAQVVVALTNFDYATEVVYPEAFHVGFFQDTNERVDEIFERLQADGFAPEPRKNYHGAWTFYLKAPGGFMVEIGHQGGVQNASVASAGAHGAA